MLLGPSALQRRLPLIIALVLAAMLIGAGFASLQQPIFRSTATVSGPADLPTIVRSGEVAQEFRSRVAAAYGDEFASTVVAFASESEQQVELAAESPFAGTAEDLTRLYAESVIAIRPDVVLDEPASFPVSARSPNLRRTALACFLVGATLGWIAAVVLERGSPTPPSADAGLDLLVEHVPPGSTPDTAEAGLVDQLPPPGSTPDTAEAGLVDQLPPSTKQPTDVTEHAPRISELAKPAQGKLKPRSPKAGSEIPRIVRLPDETRPE